MDSFDTQVLEDEPEKNSRKEMPIGFLKVESTEYEIVEGFNKIGRASSCQIVLRDLTVSKVHAEIQAGSEAVFITDLRSVNGTTLKKLPLKQFYFYPICDGDVIEFGSVKAIYKTSSREESFRQKTDGTPKTDENLDQSLVPGSQNIETKRQLFREPAIPIDHHKIRDETIKRDERSERNREHDESDFFDESMDISEMGKKRVAPMEIIESTPLRSSIQKMKRTSETRFNDSEDIHELETQPFLHSKRLRSQEPSDTSANCEDVNIFEANTQKLNASSESSKTNWKNRNHSDEEKRKNNVKKDVSNNLADVSSNDDIYEAETQVSILPEDRYNESIFEAETQVTLETSRSPEKSSRSRNMSDDEEGWKIQKKIKLSVDHSVKDVFEAETQPFIGTWRSAEEGSKSRELSVETKGRMNRETNKQDRNHSDEEDENKETNNLSVDRSDENIFEAETQVLDLPETNKQGGSNSYGKVDNKKTKDLSANRFDENIFEAETQPTDLPETNEQGRNTSHRKDGNKKTKNLSVDRFDENIFDAETQPIDLPETNKQGRNNSYGKDGNKKTKNVSVDRFDENIFEAETQPIDLPGTNKQGRSTSHGKDVNKKTNNMSANRFDENIFEAETQAMDLPETSKQGRNYSNGKDGNKKTKNLFVNPFHENIFEAETQAMDLPETSKQGRNYSDGKDGNKKLFVNPFHENIFEAETQVEDLPGTNKQGRNNFDGKDGNKKTKNLSVNPFHENIFEAETQVTDLPGKSKQERNNSNEEDANKEAIKSHVIAETDEESETDDELNIPSKKDDNENPSDGSITDENEELAMVSLKIAEEQKKLLSLSKTNEKNIKDKRADGALDETHLDLLPSIPIPTSTPLLCRRSPEDITFDESQVIVNMDDDIHEAMIHALTPPKITDSSMKIASRKREERSKSPDENPVPVHANDSIDKTMGQIFGNEIVSEVQRTSESATLMTQNLVDILNPTQIEGESGIHVEKEERRKSKILGFKNGQAVENRGSSISEDTEGSSSKENSKVLNDSSVDLANGDLRGSPVMEDDDILFGLPEVRICGTLSYPGSPAPSDLDSTDSSLTVTPKTVEKKASAGEKSGIGTPRASVGNVESAETRERSSIFDTDQAPSKKKLKPVEISRDEAESEDDLDYNQLRKMADELLASGSTNVAMKVRKGTETRSRKLSKSTTVKTNPIVARFVKELSKTSSSLTVTDAGVDDCTVGQSEINVAESSSRETKKRPRQEARNVKRMKKIIEKEDDKESTSENEVSTEISASTKIVPNTYPKVELIKLNESEVRIKKKDNSVQSNNDASAVTPITRRTRSRITKASATSPTLQIRPRRSVDSSFSRHTQRFNILFTGMKDNEYYKNVTELGGCIVEDPSKATVLITDKIRRTFKFLCAVAYGLRIVSAKWLSESVKAGKFLDLEKFTLKDKDTEQKFKFKLAKSLSVARTQKLLDDFVIVVTPKVTQPALHEIKGMVEACGGRVLVRAPRTWTEKTIILSNDDDLPAAKALLSKSPKSLKITIQTTEFLLTGILRQEINFVDHKLL